MGVCLYLTIISKLWPGQRTTLMKVICITLALFCCINGCTLLNLTVKQRQSLSCEFEYNGEGKSVCISGDFNHWSRKTHCMDRKNDRWTISLKLRPGVYRYLFWVDGARWVVDPKALFVENDGYGMQNGVVIID